MTELIDPFSRDDVSVPEKGGAGNPRVRWKELESILSLIDRESLGRVPPATILRMGNLYYEVLSDLGTYQARGADPRVRRYLNSLLARAYSRIYRKRTLRFLDSVKFFIFDIPILLRKRVHFIMTAFVIFLFSTLIGFSCVNQKSKLINLIVPEAMRSRIEEDLRQGQIGAKFPANLKVLISTQILTNNIGVSFKAFAMGLLMGLGTIYILVLNGLMLGGLASIYHGMGYPLEFWSLILPHGGIELLAVFIASGAGLILGYALINPGVYRRGEWLAHEGTEAVKILLGTIPILLLAALVEGYVTPADIPALVKIGFGMVLTLLVSLALMHDWILTQVRRFSGR